jgi:hypothetical protein
VFAAADVERAPVNDGIVRRLMNRRQAGESALNLRITHHHHAACGIGRTWNFRA